MRVKLRTTYASPLGAWGPGSVIDLPDPQGRDLIEGGYAVAVKAGKVEMATEIPIETASERKAGSAKKGRRGKVKIKLGNGSDS
jgi:hypothetical protein